jgi:hypothetical protein
VTTWRVSAWGRSSSPSTAGDQVGESVGTSRGCPGRGRCPRGSGSSRSRPGRRWRSPSRAPDHNAPPGHTLLEQSADPGRDKGRDALEIVGIGAVALGQLRPGQVLALPGGRLVGGVNRRVETLQGPTADGDGDGELLVGVDPRRCVRRPLAGAGCCPAPEPRKYSSCLPQIVGNAMPLPCRVRTSGGGRYDVRRGSRRSGTSAARARSDGS